jgi:hypothetical protein
MRNITMSTGLRAACGLVLFCGACSSDHSTGNGADWEAAASAQEARPVLVGNFEAPAARTLGEEAVQARVDSVRRALFRVRMLTAQEQAALRQDGNERQISRATQLGISRGEEVDELVRTGQLLRLPDTTVYWAVRDLRFSEPYVTPDVMVMLLEIGERFHARLDSLGVPPYRLEITSVLRTSEAQAALRRINRNASRGVSAHEFGTTIDIAYRRFSAPAIPQYLAFADPQVEVLHDSLMVEEAALRGTELQAVLGRVLREMRDEGKLLVMMERSQTVYHMTVARRFNRPAPAEAE